MPFIQLDIQEGLSKTQKEQLTKEVVAIVNDAIGSSVAHINFVIREWPTENLVEAGEANRNLLGKANGQTHTGRAAAGRPGTAPSMLGAVPGAPA
jgi:4-oxalocrotonate tautomerase family enzyme